MNEDLIMLPQNVKKLKTEKKKKKNWSATHPQSLSLIFFIHTR